MLVHAMQTSEASVKVFIFPLEATVFRLNNVEVSWWSLYGLESMLLSVFYNRK